MKIKEIMYIYAIGAIGYPFVEVVWRGYTHWSMGILGGICLLFMYIYQAHSKISSAFIKAIPMAVFVTVLEFCTGLIVNKCLKLNIWDYSDMKFNVMGQISLLYSIFWYFLCIPCLILCKILKRRVFDVFKSNYTLDKNF